MAYLSLYRKYRSQTFSDLIGQDQVVRTLQNGIAQGKIAHAFLFTGPRGTGKTSSARLLAKALNCEKGPSPEPCNECWICQSITEGSCLDVIELDAASQSGVEDVRDRIVGTVDYKPASCRYRVFIIDEVHDLSAKAFDALLKTIEEPPPHVVFVLATTEAAKVPPTIRARCQRHDFHRATLANLVERLEFVAKGEGLEADRAALVAIARMADGGYRDALTLLEQAMIVGQGKITLDLVYEQLGMIPEDAADEMLLALKDGDVRAVLERVDEFYRRGRDPRAILDSLLYRLSELTRAAYGVEAGHGSDAALEAGLHEMANRIGRDNLNRFRAVLADAHKHARDVSLPRLWLEAELVGLALPPVAPPVALAAPAAALAHSAGAQSGAPKGTPAPKPTAKAVIPMESVSSSGDPILDAARESWAKVKANLGTKSATAAARLAKVSLASLEEGVATLEFQRQMDLEWMQESAKRQALVHEEVRSVVGGEGWSLMFALAKSNGASTGMNPTVTVEMPLEGARLAEAGREIFEGA